MVNRVLIESLEKAEKKKNTTTKHSIKEIENMKKIYHAPSAFTMIMNNLLQKSGGYNIFDEMNDDILDQINISGKEIEQTLQVNKEHKQSESSDSEYEPPNKKRKSSILSSMPKYDATDSNNDSEENKEVDSSDEEDDIDD
jgi:hypothetical protein